MDAEFLRIAALPGSGRYELGFRFADGSLGTAVVEVDGDRIRVAPASLPPGWGAGSPELDAVGEAVLALHRARAHAGPLPSLRDVPGGWDVSIGNVVLTDGVPHCLADGAMEKDGDVYVCPGCGARAALDAAPGTGGAAQTTAASG